MKRLALALLALFLAAAPVLAQSIVAQTTSGSIVINCAGKARTSEAQQAAAQKPNVCRGGVAVVG
jgi:hypothetical protein